MAGPPHRDIPKISDCSLQPEQVGRRSAASHRISSSGYPFAELATLQAAPEIFDGLGDSFLELHLWLPSEDFSRPGDVRLTHFRIIHRQGPMLDRRFRSRN